MFHYFNPFRANGFFLYPLKTSEFLIFSDVFRGYTWHAPSSSFFFGGERGGGRVKILEKSLLGAGGVRNFYFGEGGGGRGVILLGGNFVGGGHINLK